VDPQTETRIKYSIPKNVKTRDIHECTGAGVPTEVNQLYAGAPFPCASAASAGVWLERFLDHAKSDNFIVFFRREVKAIPRWA
jgi:hypothetical protein